MKHLISNLKENLVQRKKNEIVKIEEFSKEGLTDLILISSGKIFELDLVISDLDEMINYIEITKKIQ